MNSSTEIVLKKLVRSTWYEQKEADLDSSCNRRSPISDANKALVRLALIRCNCSRGGSPAAVGIVDRDKLNICACLAKAFC